MINFAVCRASEGRENQCCAGEEEGSQEAVYERAAEVEAEGGSGRGPVQDLPTASLQGEEGKYPVIQVCCLISASFTGTTCS